MKPNLKIAMAEVDADFSAESAAVDAAIEEASQDIDAAIASMQTEKAPTRIKQARDWTDKLLADLAPQEEALQTKLAAADAAYDNKVADAQAERDSIKAQVTADLKQVTALRAATTVFQGELRKAEY